VLVDDEEMILTSIRTLLVLEADYEVECFTNPLDAVKFMENRATDIVVSDYLMPGLTGIQLLAEAKRLQPEAIRVLLTGHADKASAILAINQVGLFQDLEKPWDNTQLLLVIQQAVERAHLLPELRRTIMQLHTANATLKGAQAHLLSAFLMKARLPKALRAGGLRRRCARSRSGRGYFISR
jgi:DNA-binding NtrC family response regulator